MKRVGLRQNIELVNVTGLIRRFRTNNKHLAGLPERLVYFSSTCVLQLHIWVTCGFCSCCVTLRRHTSPRFSCVNVAVFTFTDIYRRPQHFSASQTNQKTNIEPCVVKKSYKFYVHF